MSFRNEQAANVTLVASSNTVYTPKTAAQIRAFTVHNPTVSPLDITVLVNSKLMVKKTLAVGATEIISALFNQQLKKDQSLTMTGEGANVLVTVVEITE